MRFYERIMLKNFVTDLQVRLLCGSYLNWWSSGPHIGSPLIILGQDFIFSRRLTAVWMIRITAGKNWGIWFCVCTGIVQFRGCIIYWMLTDGWYGWWIWWIGNLWDLWFHAGWDFVDKITGRCHRIGSHHQRLVSSGWIDSGLGDRSIKYLGFVTWNNCCSLQ